MKKVIFTIGHSTYSVEFFTRLLKRHNITVVCDVRSSPYSRFNPQFNRETLKKNLGKFDIKYVFLGKELGARSSDSTCYVNGQVRYSALAKTDMFRNGIDRLSLGVDRGYRMALMCAEKDPLDCHRTVLVARNLESNGFCVSHILNDGSIETQDEVTTRLVKQFKLNLNDLFLSSEDMIDKAFLKQELKIAYSEKDNIDQIAKKAI